MFIGKQLRQLLSQARLDTDERSPALLQKYRPVTKLPYEDEQIIADIFHHPGPINRRCAR